MKKLALIFGITFIAFACHTKEDQDKSGINDPTNITYDAVDSSVLSKPTPQAAIVKKPADHTAVMDSNTAAAAPCIDSSKISKDAMCTQEYKPVCGCDNKTYSNKCQAEKAGVTKWTEGACAGDKSKGKEKMKGKEKAKPAPAPKKKK